MTDDTRARVENLARLKSLAINILDDRLKGLSYEELQKRSFDYLAVVNPNTVIDLIDQIKGLELEVAATEYLDAEGSMVAKDLMAENRRLESELAQAKATGVQWVTFDGTLKTLPGIGSTVLFDAGEDGTIVVYYRSHPVQGRSWCHYELGSEDFSVESGDRWAYLPTPPEASHD